MTHEVSGGHSPYGQTYLPPTGKPAGARTGQPAAAEQVQPGASAPMPTVPGVQDLIREPLIGKAFALLREGARRDLVMRPLATQLSEAPVEQLERAYLTTRKTLKDLMFKPDSNPDDIAAANDMVTVTMGALRARDIDPLDLPPPNRVRFGDPGKQAQ